jgi:hypothetical protein
LWLFHPEGSGDERGENDNDKWEFHRQITTIVGGSTKNRVPGEIRPSGISLLSLLILAFSRNRKMAP